MPKHSIYKEVPIVQAETLKKVFPFQNSQILLRTLTKKKPNYLPFPNLLFFINTAYKGISVRFSACVLRASHSHF